MVAMIERKHLRIIRAVQRVVAAAQELTEAERALSRKPRRRVRAKGSRRTVPTAPGIDNQIGAARQVTQRPPDSPGHPRVGDHGADSAMA